MNTFLNAKSHRPDAPTGGLIFRRKKKVIKWKDKLNDFDRFKITGNKYNYEGNSAINFLFPRDENKLDTFDNLN